ncbi:MAG TPA: hypothetical protein EYP80_01960 [Candidatus Aenigmarchaeota archaeon]|nr:hypothetical protein [Candidatus Aenigmarchaeota archaeon]
MEEKNKQERYLKIELLNRECEQLITQINLIETKLSELSILRNSLDKLENSEGFSQLGEGIFIKSKIINNNLFLVHTGKKLFVEMDKEELKKYLDKKITDFEKVLSKLSEKKENINNEIQKEIIELQSR